MGFCPNSRLSGLAGKVCDFRYLCYLTDPCGKGSLRKILCFEVFKILFGQLVERMLENKSLPEGEAPPLAGECWRSGAYLTDPCGKGSLRKILCFEVFKILFGQLVERMLENKSLPEGEAPPLAGECWRSGAYFWPYESTMVPYLLSENLRRTLCKRARPLLGLEG